MEGSYSRGHGRGNSRAGGVEVFARAGRTGAPPGGGQTLEPLPAGPSGTEPLEPLEPLEALEPLEPGAPPHGSFGGFGCHA